MNKLIFKNLNKQNGLTMLELVVVMGIFAVVSIIMLFNYSKYQSSISVNNLAQDIALTIRKAQVYAIGVKGTDVSGGSKQFPGYGIHFYLPNISGNPTDGDSRSFIFFSDIPMFPGGIGDKTYNQLTSSCDNLMFGNECMNIVTIKGNDRITELCNGATCVNSVLSPSVDIIFTRPNPEPMFCFKTNGSSCSSLASYISVKIQSIDGTEKVVSVWNTGQIRID
jgi:prepilin-type N-terminal cleavage/methylation domain-containing protein